MLRLFAAARVAAGTGTIEIEGTSVGEIVDQAVARFGPEFAAVLGTARLWVNGEPADRDAPVAPGDEVAVLPPVSGGAVDTKPPAKKKKPATKAAVAKGSGAASKRGQPPTAPQLVDRLFAPVDTTGHKVLLGLLWVAVQVGAWFAGSAALAVVFGVVAAVAGLHAAKAWRPAGRRPSRVVAGIAPLAVTLGAVHSAGVAGLVVLAAVAASVVVSVSGSTSRQAVIGSAGTTVRCWFPMGLAAASVVFVNEIEPSAAAMLLLLVAGYDVGAFIWGAGSRADSLVGRMAGMITVVVLTFSASAVQLVISLEPFQTTAAVWVFGGMVVVLAPLGQLVASALLPAAASDAPALRRLDALLLAAPAWTFALWGYIA